MRWWWLLGGMLLSYRAYLLRCVDSAVLRVVRTSVLWELKRVQNLLMARLVLFTIEVMSGDVSLLWCTVCVVDLRTWWRALRPWVLWADTTVSYLDDGGDTMRATLLR